MCGLAGFVGRGDDEDLRAMTQHQAHRGPDGDGYHIDRANAVFLGHRRLAVIDIAGGVQPMWNETGDVAVVFNGEIYNHAALRVELQALGHVFGTDHSDTEVLVHGYESWGEKLPERLNGMFAFAIYDRPRQRIMLARDRFGEKPLYYARRPGLFAFASELTALGRHRGIPLSIAPQSLAKYLGYGFLPSPHALYRDCYKLPPGSVLMLAVAGLDTRVRRYFQYRVEPDDALARRDEAALAEELQALLLGAVRDRLISDVPLGMFLSGGIDSSGIVACAARAVPPSQIRSFTVGFEEPSFDESGFARAVAKAIGTAHHETTLSSGIALDAARTVLARMDEPIGDPSILPTYLLSAFTRKHVTVALSGDGGDELFAGYDPFKALRLAAWYDRLVPGVVHRAGRALADRLPISAANMSFDFKLRRALTGLSYPPPLWNPAWLGPLEPQAIAEIVGERVDPEALYSEAITLWNGCATGTLEDRTTEFYANLYLPENILAKVDRASMMSALEVRAPFLDNHVVDFVRKLPHHMKHRSGTGKYLLKKALAGLVPEAILQRPKKGFGIPLVAWLERLLPTQPHCAGAPAWVDCGAVGARWRDHHARARDNRLFLWAWLALEQHLEGAHSAAVQHA